MTESELRRTPLFNVMKDQGAKFVPFAGWEMPVQFEGLRPEHEAVRQRAGIFDVSHMGEIFVEGPEALAALEYLTPNRVSKLADGQAQYSALLNERGGVVDDIIIYRFSAERFLICVNAANCQKDFEWIQEHNPGSARIEDRSAEYAQIALQGPQALAIFQTLSGVDIEQRCPYFSFLELKLPFGQAIVARTGYTGEDGLELFVAKDLAESAWLACMEAGHAQGLRPAGLGARDSLRLEACYPLHGNELGDDFSALESGLSWIVKFKKGDFLGRQALLEQKEAGVPRQLVAFVMEEAGIARHEDPIRVDENGDAIGVVTSGTMTPTVSKELGKAIGMAIVESDYKAPDTVLQALVRGKPKSLRVVKKPFYKRA